LNFQNAVLGFPNKISDDPLLELVLTQSDEYEYAEERRLLYVAITRTKNRTFILVDETRASEFFKEFPASDTTFILSSNSGNAAPSVSCPRCKTGKLIIRENEATHEKFIGCSHYPHCGYTVNDATALQKNHRCPRCDGFLVKRHSQRGDFYGCSNYPLCDHTQNAIYRIAGQK
jgi:DNA helicase-4